MRTRARLPLLYPLAIMFSLSLLATTATTIMPHTLLAQGTNTTNLLTYQNSTYSIKIQYPSN